VIYNGYQKNIFITQFVTQTENKKDDSMSTLDNHLIIKIKIVFSQWLDVISAMNEIKG